ncbi:MAG: ATP synthase subunit I [Caldilineaceae bacterium]|nr:ATP synthase subunit I [Caldilineaceae bacterium]
MEIWSDGAGWRQIAPVLIGFGGGLVLGWGYFGGLWWTVRRLTSARRPALLFAGSFVIRTGLVIGGLFMLANGGWISMAAALVGLLAMRVVLTRRWGPPSTAL